MKTATPSKRLVECIRETQEMATALQRDVSLALDKLIPLVATFEDGTSDHKPIDFWTRTTIRCFMGLLDGLSFSMRQAVLRCASDVGLTLTPGQEADLKRNHLPTLASFKLAFRTFPRLFGSDYELDLGGQEWRGLIRIARVRDNFTHPKALEHLAVHPAFPALLPTIAWVYREILTLFSTIHHDLGLPGTHDIPQPGFPAFRESHAPWVKIFKDQDYLLIKSYGSRTLAYVKRWFFMLSDDTKEAMDLGRGFSTRAAVSSPMVQFAFRTYTRTLFSEIEGATSAARFFVEAGALRRKVTLSQADTASLDEGQVEDRFVAACNLWAREFGNGYVISKADVNWKHLRGARAFRNRITHPKNLRSLRVDLDLMQTLLGAHSFFVEGWGEALYIEPAKWPEMAEGIGELIEKEEAQAKADLASEDT